nr:unnamed protein product [Callosobruchus analis]
MANIGMKIGPVNVCSLTPKINYIKDLLVLEDISILGITESWLSYKIPNEFIDIDGYQPIEEVEVVGSVCMCAITLITSQESGALEALWLNVKVKNVTIKIGFVYRPPIYTNLSKSLYMLEKFLEDIIILGDFTSNINLDQGRASELLLDTLDTYGLKQIVNDPTRKKSLLDIVAISYGLESNLKISAGPHFFRFMVKCIHICSRLCHQMIFRTSILPPHIQYISVHSTNEVQRSTGRLMTLPMFRHVVAYLIICLRMLNVEWSWLINSFTGRTEYPILSTFTGYLGLRHSVLLSCETKVVVNKTILLLLLFEIQGEIENYRFRDHPRISVVFYLIENLKSAAGCFL